jgi:hypothetical protein
MSFPSFYLPQFLYHPATTSGRILPFVLYAPENPEVTEGILTEYDSAGCELEKTQVPLVDVKNESIKNTKMKEIAEALKECENKEFVSIYLLKYAQKNESASYVTLRIDNVAESSRILVDKYKKGYVKEQCKQIKTAMDTVDGIPALISHLAIKSCTGTICTLVHTSEVSRDGHVEIEISNAGPICIEQVQIHHKSCVCARYSVVSQDGVHKVHLELSNAEELCTPTRFELYVKNADQNWVLADWLMMETETEEPAHAPMKTFAGVRRGSKLLFKHEKKW